MDICVGISAGLKAVPRREVLTHSSSSPIEFSLSKDRLLISAGPHQEQMKR